MLVACEFLPGRGVLCLHFGCKDKMTAFVFERQANKSSSNGLLWMFEDKKCEQWGHVTLVLIFGACRCWQCRYDCKYDPA
ncbi:hypothetical protein FKM82_009705 [Ascaphus truei]